MSYTPTDIKRIPQFGGNIYYVSNTMGDDDYDGLSPLKPFETIQKALDTVIAGDGINVMAGNYAENSLDLDVNSVEIWFELGAQISPTGGTALIVSGNFCRVTCPNGALKINPSSGELGVVVTGNFCYLNEIRVAAGSTGTIGFDIQGDGCDLRRCRCSDPTTAAYKIQGDAIKLEACCTGGNSTDSSIGYWMTNSCDKFRLISCGSQGHLSGGFVVDSGCTNGVIWQFSSGGGDGKWCDADSNTIISDLTYEETKYATMTLDGSTSYNLFKITGAVKVFNIFGHVTTAIADTSSTLNLELGSTNAQIDITDSAGAPNIQADVVNTVYAKEAPSTEPLEKGEPDTTPAVVENSNFRDPAVPIILIEDDKADTYIQAILSDAVASGVIHWHVEWIPITDDGFLEPA